MPQEEMNWSMIPPTSERLGEAHTRNVGELVLGGLAEEGSADALVGEAVDLLDEGGNSDLGDEREGRSIPPGRRSWRDRHREERWSSRRSGSRPWGGYGP